MTVAEWIKLWDSYNISTIPLYFYYKNEQLPKYKLYHIKNELTSIKLSSASKPLTDFDMTIYHNHLSEFNYDQEQFLNNLRVEIPEGSFLYSINIYIN